MRRICSLDETWCYYTNSRIWRRRDFCVIKIKIQDGVFFTYTGYIGFCFVNFPSYPRILTLGSSSVQFRSRECFGWLLILITDAEMVGIIWIVLMNRSIKAQFSDVLKSKFGKRSSRIFSRK